MKSKKFTKVLYMVMTLVLTLVLSTVVCYAGPLDEYKGFNELKKLLKDILTVISGFMAIIAIIFFAYAIIGDRPEHKLTAMKVLAGGGLMFLLAQSIDKFF